MGVTSYLVTLFFDPWIAKVLKPDQAVRFNWENLEPFIFAVLLASRIALWEKSRDSCELWSNLMILRTAWIATIAISCFLSNDFYYKLKVVSYRESSASSAPPLLAINIPTHFKSSPPRPVTLLRSLPRTSGTTCHHHHDQGLLSPPPSLVS